MDTITPQQNFITSRLTFVNNNSNSSSNNNNRTRPYNISCVVKAFIAQQQQQQQGINTNNNNNNNQRQYSNSTGNGIRSFIRNNNNGDSNNNINSNNNSSVQGTALTTSTPQQTLIRNLNIINNIYNNQKNDIAGNNAVIANNIRQQQQQQQNQTSNLLIGGINNNGLLNRNINNLISNNNITNNNNDKQFENGPILSERYLILKQLPGSSFYNCMDIKTGESLICKAIGNSYQKILNAYFRMDSFEHIKPLHKLLQTTSTDETYLLLPPSQYGDLHSFVRERKRLREPEARYLFRQICKTVKECHQQGIVLRDLKLRKFVFSDKERTHLKFESLEDAVVLDDYENDILKEKIGCPAYVAPEILKPNSDFSGKAADLWSLGVILYTMLVGRYPFNDPEHSSLFAKIARCTFTIPDFVSPKAKCLIKSLLQKVPKHRLTSDDLLDHQWLQSDSMITSNGGGYDSNSNNIGSFALASATNNYELSLDDHRVPDIESVEFT